MVELNQFLAGGALGKDLVTKLPHERQERVVFSHKGCGQTNGVTIITAVARIILSLILLALPAMAATERNAERPDGVSEQAWFRIMEDLEEDRYNALSLKGPKDSALFRFSNKSHEISADFSSNSVNIKPQNRNTWNFELGFVGYGYEKVEKKSIGGIKPVAEDNRIEYRYDGITEWYINSNKGIEQGFTLSSRPENRAGGLLAIELLVKGTLIPLQSGTEHITLRDNNGRTILKYGGLKAWDADDKPLDHLQASQVRVWRFTPYHPG